MTSRHLVLLSSSTVHGSEYLEYCESDLKSFLGSIRTVLFVPYARPSGISLDAYTARARPRFIAMGYQLNGIHEAPDAHAALETADALFVGGGNTFLLLKTLHEQDLIAPIRARVTNGMRYIGSSAGTNVAGRSIGTSNDMPIVYPPTFDALALVPFNVNPHYIDADPESKHKGETRETRIKEFHFHNPQPVVGIREGSAILVEHQKATLLGGTGGKLFRPKVGPTEIEEGANLSALL